MTRPPSVVVFDIGNVLLTWDPDLVYAELLPEPTERAAFMAETGLEAVNAEIDRGAPFRETIYALADAHPQRADLIRAWYDRWEDMVPGLIEQNCEILRELRGRNVPVYALSNFGVDTFAFAEAKYPILKEFDRRYISGQLGMIKPDAEIYAHVAADSGKRGEDLFFIDDLKDNIEAAMRQKWHCFLEDGSADLRAALKDFALL